MSGSPRDCSEDLSKVLQEILWRQWGALGVSAHGAVEERFVLDVEALMVATFSNAPRDERLLRSSLEWLSAHGRLVSRSRILRIGKAWADAAREHRVQVFAPETSARVNAFLESIGDQPLGFLGPTDEMGDVEHRGGRFPDADGGNKRIRPLDGRWPGGGQLLLRELFGVNARAESLLYLLTRGSGSSLGIARSTGHDQKSVYRMLEGWTRAGMVRKGGRGGGYRLAHPERWRGLFGVGDELVLPDWSIVLRALCLAAVGLGSQPRADDPYLASSFLRDVLPTLEETGRLLGVVQPDLAGAGGAAAFEPASEALLSIGAILAGIQ